MLSNIIILIVSLWVVVGLICSLILGPRVTGGRLDFDDIGPVVFCTFLGPASVIAYVMMKNNLDIEEVPGFLFGVLLCKLGIHDWDIHTPASDGESRRRCWRCNHEQWRRLFTNKWHDGTPCTISSFEF